jgi:oligoribonuclease (3'-5' exoribonuclease)
MTGLDPEKERLLEIAVVVTGPNLSPRVEGPVCVIHQSDELLNKMDAWNKGTHGRSGLIDKVKASKLTEQDAEEQILAFIKKYVSKSRPTVSCEVHAQIRSLFALPQLGCQHSEGTVQTLEAGSL